MTEDSDADAVELIALSRDRSRLLQLLRERALRESCAIKAVSRAAGAAPTRLACSWSQRRLWFVDQLEGTGAAYHIAVVLRLRGALDEAALREALDGLAKRHEVLRTVFVSVDGEPQQEIQAEGRFVLNATDLSELSAEERAAQLQHLKIEEAHERFDLRTGPLIRGRLIRIGSQEHLLLVTMHHIVSDGWSMDVFIRELSALYTARREDRESPLAPLPVQYADYAQWQRQWLETGTLEKELGYWHAQLHGAAAHLELPTDRRRPAAPSYRGGTVPVVLDAALSGKLKALAQRYEMTLFMVLCAGWAILLARLSGQDEVVIGTPIANRHRPELEGLIGFFVNTLALRIEVHGALSVEQFLHKVRQTALGAFDHQDAPFEKVVENLQPPRSLNRHPLFQVMLSLRNVSGDPVPMSGLTVTLEEGGYDAAKFDQLLTLEERGDQIVGTLNYAADLFERKTIEEWVACFAVLLRGMAEHVHASVHVLPILPPEQWRQVIESFNSPHTEYPQERLIHEIFEEQVARTPDAVALVYEQQSLTYAELNGRANQLARYLRERGVGPEGRVALLLERGLEMVVALIAVLKAGGAYVPIDPDHPTERINYILNDAAPVTFVTQQQLRTRLPPTSAPSILVDRDRWAIDAQPASAPTIEDCECAAHRLAYVIYTSGSTGAPKGVAVEHRNVTRLFYATDAKFHFSARDTWTLFHSIAFDFSVWEIWGALLYGGRLIVVPKETSRSPDDFYSLICAQGVTILNQTPSAFLQLIHAQARNSGTRHSLRIVVFGGERLDLKSLLPWVEQNGADAPQLVNMYGITETTVHVTYHCITERDIHRGHRSLIGTPIRDLFVYLLDASRQPVPAGVVGEIYVGGAGVARGYTRPALTDERFLADPFARNPHARMYRSGDLARWSPNGTLEYLGRNDAQVKIRGFRIEPAEIEVRLAEHPGVARALVVAREDVPGDTRLVAYVVPKSAADDDVQPSAESLRAQLRSHLPDYMVPRAFVCLPALPLTANGKIDRRALPMPGLESYHDRPYRLPQGKLEDALAEVWKDLLHVERVGRDDSFFELGGHSLLIAQMVDRLRRLGLSTETRRILESPILKDVARQLVRIQSRAQEVPANPIPAGCAEVTPEMLPLVDLQEEHIRHIERRVPGGGENIQDVYPLTSLQEGLLFHHLLGQQGSDTYVVPFLLSVASRGQLDQLVDGFQKVIDRHDVFRTAVLWEDLPRPVQVVYRRVGLAVEHVTLDVRRESLTQVMEWLEPAHQRIDIRTAPLIRLRIASDPHEQKWYVLLQFHHIVCDHVTIEVVTSEVVSHLAKRAQTFPEPIPYRVHVERTLTHAGAHDAESFFREKLGDVVDASFPFGLQDTHRDGTRIGQARAELGMQLARRVRIQARRFGVSPATLFHAAWALVVGETSGRDDVVFGSVLLGRLHSSDDASLMLGLLINTLPVRLRLAGITADQLIQQTQRELIGILNHETASLSVAQRCSGLPAKTPLFSALLNYRHSVPNIEGGWAKAEGVRLLAGQERTNYPITVSIDDLGESFYVTAQTDERVAPQRVIGYLQQAVLSLTEALEQAPSTPALALSILPENERRQVTEQFNATRAHYPDKKLVHELVEEQVARTPDELAIVHEGQTLTYAQLNAKANALARMLRAEGVKPDAPVAIVVERGPEMVVGLLGILKAGGAYLPLDPGYPMERLTYMLSDSGARLLLAQRQLMNFLPSEHRIELDAGMEAGAADTTNLGRPADWELGPRHLAYVIYTSGSTGRPKGTAMSHGAMVNLLEWHRKNVTQEKARVLQFAALSFDVSFQEIFSTLCSGGTLVLAGEAVRKDARALTEFLDAHRIQRLFVPPLMLQSLAEWGHFADRMPTHLKDVIVAGEQLHISREVRAFFQSLRQCRLHNHYGPTETHVVTALSLSGNAQEWPSIPSIGRPIQNTQIYVLNPQQRPLPIGVVGEIYIGGAGVARGYLNRETLTRERFVASPLTSDPEVHLYRTGDLGRWREDGTLDYLGRQDNQVKVRGYRIELDEIEAQLSGHPDVKGVAVVTREDAPGEKRLVAYVTERGDTRPTADSLRAHLRERLPEHMIPSAFVVLRNLPATPNGKLDRLALPAPGSSAYTSREYESPQGELEQTLAGIWQEVLNLHRVGRGDSFFELGGDSLTAMRVLVRIQSKMSLEIPVSAFFRFPTLRELSTYLQSIRHARRVARLSAGGEAVQKILAAVDSMQDGERRADS